MLSRALILAAVTVLLGWFAAHRPAAAQNLEAGKPPSQIFSSTCSICHRSSRGLLKSVSPGSLPSFLREHYTTSRDMASVMAAFVLSNGAANAPLPGGNLTKQGQDSRTAPKPDTGGSEQASRDGTKSRRPQREASRPDVDGLAAVPGGRDAAADGAQSDAPKPNTKQKASKGKAGPADPPKDEAKASEPAKDDAARADGTRPDPVPQVTPAGQGSDTPVAAGPKTVAELPTGPLTIDLGTPPAPSSAVAVAPGPPAGPPRVPVSQ